MHVTKKNGTLQKFSRTKLYRGIRKAGAGIKDADWVTKQVMKHVYDKISTRKIGEMVATNLRKVDKKTAASFKKVFSRNWGL